MTPKMTYQDGHFFLHNADFLSVNKSEWTFSPYGHLTTKNLKAAARFKTYADRHALERFKNASPIMYENHPPPLPSFLDPHQVEGVKWILSRRSSYLAHAPGAGKTAQALIASYLVPGNERVLIIVPPSLIENWVREIQKFIPEFVTIGIINGGVKPERVAWLAQYILVSDAMLAKPSVILPLAGLKTKMLIVDEASRFKEPNTNRSKALYGNLLKAKHIVFLDGSPMPNRPMELWAPTFNLCPEAIEYMSEEDFGFRYCGAEINDFGRWEFKRSQNEVELRDRLRKDFMHVVTEDKLNHAERIRSLTFIDNGVLNKTLRAFSAAQLTKLRVSDISEDASKGDLATIRKEIGLAKVKTAAEYIKSKWDKGESIIVFAWHREVCIALHQALFTGGLVMGGTSAKDRESIFTRFQNGELDIIVGNIAAMGRGHNLQKADRIIFVEYSWTDELNKQCEKRASRRGRDASLPVRCEYLVVSNSLDEVVLNSVMNKARSVKKVIG